MNYWPELMQSAMGKPGKGGRRPETEARHGIAMIRTNDRNNRMIIQVVMRRWC